MKKQKNNLLLTDEQAYAVRWNIISSMLDAYREQTGSNDVTETYESAAARIADKIISMTQGCLLQQDVCSALTIRCNKAKKTTKKAVKKVTLPKKFGKMTKKHGR